MTSEYGTYRLSYTPPNDPNPDYPLIGIEMTTSGDASVDQMLKFFEAFLSGAGYVLRGELQIVEPEMTRHPWDSSYFVPFSSYGDDIISSGGK